MWSGLTESLVQVGEHSDLNISCVFCVLPVIMTIRIVIDLVLSSHANVEMAVSQSSCCPDVTVHMVVGSSIVICYS